MTDLEKRIKAKIPGPDTGIEIRRTMCGLQIVSTFTGKIVSKLH